MVRVRLELTVRQKIGINFAFSFFIHISGGSRIYKTGAPNPKVGAPIYLAYFSREMVWVPGARPPPLRSTNAYDRTAFVAVLNL